MIPYSWTESSEFCVIPIQISGIFLELDKLIPTICMEDQRTKNGLQILKMGTCTTDNKL